MLSFMQPGLGIAAYTSVVNWNSGTDSLFPRAQEILCRYRHQPRKQFLYCALCYCGGENNSDFLLLKVLFLFFSIK